MIVKKSDALQSNLNTIVPERKHMKHSFDVEIANELGIASAVIYENISWWCRKNKANKHNFKDGKYWTYNSVSAFSELFPYITKYTIKEALKKLIEHKYIEKSQSMSDNPYDKTNWYADIRLVENDQCRLAENDQCTITVSNHTITKGESEASSEHKNGDDDVLDYDKIQSEIIKEEFEDIWVQYREAVKKSGRNLTDKKYVCHTKYTKCFKEIRKTYPEVSNDDIFEFMFEEITEGWTPDKNGKLYIRKLETTLDWKNFLMILEEKYGE